MAVIFIYVSLKEWYDGGVGYSVSKVWTNIKGEVDIVGMVVGMCTRLISRKESTIIVETK